MRTLHWTSVFGALALCLTFGCGTSPPEEPVRVGPPASGHAGHDHPHEGPHHGVLIELGEEEYHAEAVNDHDKHTVTIYILDSAAKDAVAIDTAEVTINLMVEGQPQQFALPAAPQESDPAGKSSRFQLESEPLSHAIDDPKSAARLNVTIGDKPFVGAIEAHAHDHAHGEAGHSQK